MTEEHNPLLPSDPEGDSLERSELTTPVLPENCTHSDAYHLDESTPTRRCPDCGAKTDLYGNFTVGITNTVTGVLPNTPAASDSVIMENTREYLDSLAPEKPVTEECEHKNVQLVHRNDAVENGGVKFVSIIVCQDCKQEGRAVFPI